MVGGWLGGFGWWGLLGGEVDGVVKWLGWLGWSGWLWVVGSFGGGVVGVFRMVVGGALPQTEEFLGPGWGASWGWGGWGGWGGGVGLVGWLVRVLGCGGGWGGPGGGVVRCGPRVDGVWTQTVQAQVENGFRRAPFGEAKITNVLVLFMCGCLHLKPLFDCYCARDSLNLHP